MCKNALRSSLMHALARGADIDSPQTTIRRATIIREKSFLNQIYQEWYRTIASHLPGDIQGPVLELGAGGGFLSEYIAELVTSDLLKVPFIDLVLDAQQLPFRDATLKGIVMVDVLHHLPDAVLFLGQAARCVKSGGVIVMIEPWHTKWSALIYRYLHHEPFDPDSNDWEKVAGGPLSQANSALPWIIFERDRAIFERTFSEWIINRIQLHTPFCYLLSGGVSFRSFLPGSLYGWCRKVENSMQPWMQTWAMFATIVLVRQ